MLNWSSAMGKNALVALFLLGKDSFNIQDWLQDRLHFWFDFIQILFTVTINWDIRPTSKSFPELAVEDYHAKPQGLGSSIKHGVSCKPFSSRRWIWLCTSATFFWNLKYWSILSIGCTKIEISKKKKSYQRFITGANPTFWKVSWVWNNKKKVRTNLSPGLVL